jgi:hypothetical protein
MHMHLQLELSSSGGDTNHHNAAARHFRDEWIQVNCIIDLHRLRCCKTLQWLHRKWPFHLAIKEASAQLFIFVAAQPSQERLSNAH